MKNLVVKRALFYSFLGHLTFFSLFSFTVGPNAAFLNHSDIYFWGGGLLRFNQTLPAQPVVSISLFKPKPDISALEKRGGSPFLTSTPNIKPQIALVSNREETALAKGGLPWIKPPSKKEQVILFHPVLPYDFSLYFSDRQIAHVELEFNINPHEAPDAILVRRKISSGNLEVDLLSMRNIEHYLFIQEARFTPNRWQTVKIDLSGG